MYTDLTAVALQNVRRLGNAFREGKISIEQYILLSSKESALIRVFTK